MDCFINTKKGKIYSKKRFKKTKKTYLKVLDILNKVCYTVQAVFGEVSEWFKEPVLKTGDSERDRGFESHLLRYNIAPIYGGVIVI